MEERVQRIQRHGARFLWCGLPSAIQTLTGLDLPLAAGSAESTWIIAETRRQANLNRGRWKSLKRFGPIGKSRQAQPDCGRLLFGQLPGGGVKKGNVEIYDQGRYLTITGHHLDGTPDDLMDCGAAIGELYLRISDGGTKTIPPNDLGPDETEKSRNNGSRIPDDNEIITKIERSKKGDEFRRLWGGDWQRYPSQSEADLALMDLLVFWTGPDERRADALFRRSGLMRDKWDERHYGNGTRMDSTPLPGAEGSHGVLRLDQAEEEKKGTQDNQGAPG